MCALFEFVMCISVFCLWTVWLMLAYSMRIVQRFVSIFAAHSDERYIDSVNMLWRHHMLIPTAAPISIPATALCKWQNRISIVWLTFLYCYTIKKKLIHTQNPIGNEIFLICHMFVVINISICFCSMRPWKNTIGFLFS